MNCPVDNTQLQMTERQGIEIDYCPTCRGVWLDRGELDKIIDRNAMAPSRLDRDDDDDYDRSRSRDRDDDDDYDRSRSRDRDVFPRDRDAYPAYPASGYGHGEHRPHKKRRGLLGELFDFD